MYEGERKEGGRLKEEDEDDEEDDTQRAHSLSRTHSRIAYRHKSKAKKKKKKWRVVCLLIISGIKKEGEQEQDRRQDTIRTNRFEVGLRGIVKLLQGNSLGFCLVGQGVVVLIHAALLRLAHLLACPLQ